jgi:hypothetical protein
MRWTWSAGRLNACEITWKVPSITDQDETSSQNPEMVIVSQNRAAASGSPRGHMRSHSDVTQSDDSKQAQHSDKKTVRTILSHLLPASSAMAPIQVCLRMFSLWGLWWLGRKCEFFQLRGNLVFVLCPTFSFVPDWHIGTVGMYQIENCNWEYIHKHTKH